jgi:hypothetical protein
MPVLTLEAQHEKLKAINGSGKKLHLTTVSCVSDPNILNIT